MKINNLQPIKKVRSQQQMNEKQSQSVNGQSKPQPDYIQEYRELSNLVSHLFQASSAPSNSMKILSEQNFPLKNSSMKGSVSNDNEGRQESSKRVSKSLRLKWVRQERSKIKILDIFLRQQLKLCEQQEKIEELERLLNSQRSKNTIIKRQLEQYLSRMEKEDSNIIRQSIKLWLYGQVDSVNQGASRLGIHPEVFASYVYQIRKLHGAYRNQMPAEKP